LLLYSSEGFLKKGIFIMGLNNTTTDLDGSSVIKRIGKAVQTGTSAQHSSYTGELGEITMDTTDSRLVLHDGSTAGGAPVAKESENSTNTTNISTNTTNIATNVTNISTNATAITNNDPVGGEFTYAAGLATVASGGTAVKVVAVTTPKGDANGITVGNDNTMTATFTGTKLLNVKGRFDVDVATGTDNLTLHIYVDGASVFETAAQSVTAASQVQYEIDVLLDVANGDTIELYAENEDTTENVDTIAYSDRLDIVGSHGWLRVTGA
jgi:hypothetical protein